MAAITPLTWLMFACNLMGYFFLISWTPTLMGAAHVPPQTAALAGAALQVGGTVGALVLCWWLQRQRFLAIAILFVIAVPVVASIGYAGLTSTTALLIATFFAGFIVLGIQSGINVVGALIYPTSLRANGSGWQLGIGRLGAIVGPLLGALFVGLPVSSSTCGRRCRSPSARWWLHHLRAEHRAARGASGIGQGAVSDRLTVSRSRDRKIRTAHTRAAPGSLFRRTAGSSAAARPPAGRRN